MNVIYNSPHFYVVQFSDFGENGAHPAGGFEIVDKSLRREIFLGGKDAEQFQAMVEKLIAADDDEESTVDDFDAFLTSYSGLMQQPVVLH